MKATLVTGLALFGSRVAGQLAEIRHGHMRLPGMVITDTDGKKVIMVENAAAQSDVPGVIVYVDPKSSVIRTTTEMVHIRPLSKPTAVRARPTAARGPHPPVHIPGHGGGAPIPQPPATLVTSTLPPSPIPPKAKPGPQPQKPSSDGNATFQAGVTYSPYNPDGTCRTAAQILDDFHRIAAQSDPPFSLVRIYGVDCDQVARVMPAADAIGVKLFMGIFNLDDLSSQIDALVVGVRASSRGWDAVDTVSVGNELVNNGQATAKQVMDAVAAARASLRSAGYQGPVVTVDTFLAVERNPILCDASDYCAVNIHAFFDANTAAGEAGNFVARKVLDVKEVLSNKDMKVVVTESGWPWQGNTNGKAVPGRENQRTAVRSIVDVFQREAPGGLILFTAFDDGWKKAEPWTFYAEQFWGMYPQS
ncbi:hypothetical protein OQA88_8522 [Cercophora sp. LCS_1]